VVVVPDHPGGEAGSEHVPVPAVATIEALSVGPVQVLHSLREAFRRRLEHEVVVRAHEAEGVALPLVALDDQRKEGQEEASVVVVHVDVPPKDASGRDVEDAVRQLATADAWHDGDRSADARGRPTLWRIRHELGTNAMSTADVLGGQAPGLGR
jgi:hypothetical protein